MSLGQRIAELRQIKGVSLQQVAGNVGVSKAHIWQLEKGNADNPALGLVVSLARYFGVSVSYLAGEDYAGQPLDPELAGLFREAQSFTDRERQLLFDFVKSIVETRPGHPRAEQRALAKALMTKQP